MHAHAEARGEPAVHRADEASRPGRVGAGAPFGRLHQRAQAAGNRLRLGFQLRQLLFVECALAGDVLQQRLLLVLRLREFRLLRAQVCLQPRDTAHEGVHCGFRLRDLLLVGAYLLQQFAVGLHDLAQHIAAAVEFAEVAGVREQAEVRHGAVLVGGAEPLRQQALAAAQALGEPLEALGERGLLLAGAGEAVARLTQARRHARDLLIQLGEVAAYLALLASLLVNRAAQLANLPLQRLQLALQLLALLRFVLLRPGRQTQQQRNQQRRKPTSVSHASHRVQYTQRPHKFGV